MKKTIKLANNWTELTLSMFWDIQDVYNSDIPPEEKTLKTLAILSHEDEALINSIPFQDFASLATQLEFLKHIPLTVCPNKISVNGNKYVVVNDLTRLTTAQYFDFYSMFKEYQRNEDRETFAKMCAIFLIPEGKNYLDGYELDSVVQDVYDISYSTINSLADFFLRSRKLFMKTTVNYLLSLIKNKKQRVKIKKELKENKMTHTALLEMLAQSVK